MNGDLLLIGIICLVGGVMGYMYVSDQVDNYYLNSLFSGKSNHIDYSTYKTATYFLAGLAVLGGALTAAGIFSPSPPVTKRQEVVEEEPPRKLDEATRRDMRQKYLKYGAVLLFVGGVGFFLLPSSLQYVSHLIAVFGFMLVAFSLVLY